MIKKYAKYFVRFGFIVRGIVYVLLGIYGVKSAIGLSGEIKNTFDIVSGFNNLPFGKTILIFIFFGFIGYGSWGIIRSFFDPLNKGKDIAGITTRIGYFSSGVSYFALSVLPFHLIFSIDSVYSSGTKNIANLLNNFTGGFILIMILGLIIIVSGLGQVIYGLKEDFRNALIEVKSQNKKKIIILTGKIGYISRGIIYTILGIFFFKAGVVGDSIQAKDSSEILNWIWEQTGGSILLGLFSLGLIALGSYLIISSTVIKFKKNETI